MPGWLRTLLRFLIAVLGGTLTEFYAERKRIEEAQARGAADQQEAEKKNDEQKAREAEGLAHEIENASQSDVDRRFDRFRVHDR